MVRHNWAKIRWYGFLQLRRGGFDSTQSTQGRRRGKGQRDTYCWLSSQGSPAKFAVILNQKTAVFAGTCFLANCRDGWPNQCLCGGAKPTCYLKIKPSSCRLPQQAAPLYVKPITAWDNKNLKLNDKELPANKQTIFRSIICYLRRGKWHSLGGDFMF